MSGKGAASALIIWAGLTGHAFAESPPPQDSSAVRILVAAPTAADVTTASLSREDEPARARVTQVFPASFTHLRPGTFIVKVDAKGGSAATTTVKVGPREIVTLHVEREGTGAAGLRVRVAGRVPLGEGVDFEERWLDDLPSGRDLWSLIETAAPYVIADRMDTGGIGLGHSALLGGRGASWTSNSVTFGDVRVLAPNVAGLIPINPDMSAVSEVSVTSGLAQIEADTPGVVVAVLPKRPGAARRGSLQASFTEPKMVDDKALPTAPAIARISTWREVAGQISLPVGGRTGLLLSAAAATSKFFERSLPGLWRSESASLFGHLVSNATDRDQLRVVAAAQRVKYPFEYRRQFVDRSVTERGTFLQASGAWNRMTGGAHASASLGFQRGTFTPKIANPTGGTVDRVTDGLVPAPAASTVSSEWELNWSIAPRMLTWGGSTHEWRVGLNGRRAALTTDVLALPTVAEQVAGIAARVWMPNAGTAGSHRTRFSGAAYVADRITLGPSLSIEAGVRADLGTGSAEGAADDIRWQTVSPRGSFQWSRGALSIFGGAGLYSDPLTLARLGFGDPGETVTDVYRWHDFNNDRRYDNGERGVLVSRKGWGKPVASIDPQLRAPRTFERTLGLELRYRQALTFRSAIIYRDLTDLLASVNTGVPISSYRVLFIQDQYADWVGPDDDQPLAIYDRLPASFGKDAYLLTNPEGEKATYEGLEFTWNLTTRRLWALFGVTAYRTRMWSGHVGFGPLENDHGILGERLEQPNAQPEVQGSYIFDRSYVAKLSASFRAPGDIRFAFSARYQDGQPFSRIVIAPDLAGGAEMIHAYRIGRTRFTYTLTLDVRIAKDFSIAGRRSSVFVDVFNATRHLNEVEEDVLTTPAFRRSTAMQPPLAARLGFRIVF